MDKEKKNLLVFGYGLAMIIGLIVWRHSVKHGAVGPISSMFLVFAAGVLILTVINYKLIKPFYDKWMVVAHLIGTIIFGVLLSILFYLIFGISGIVLRLLRKDLLDQKLEPQRDSYWIKRDVKEFDKESYERQF